MQILHCAIFAYGSSITNYFRRLGDGRPTHAPDATGHEAAAAAEIARAGAVRSATAVAEDRVVARMTSRLDDRPRYSGCEAKHCTCAEPVVMQTVVQGKIEKLISPTIEDIMAFRRPDGCAHA